MREVTGARSAPSRGQAPIGVIAPESNIVVAEDVDRLLPPDVRGIVESAPVFGASEREQLFSLGFGITRAAENLALRGASCAGFACTSGSFIGGDGYEPSLVAAMQRAITGPCATTSGAIVRAFRSLKASNIAMLTPYSTSVNGLESAYLSSAGIRVVADVALDVPAALRPSVQLDELLTAARKLPLGSVDLLFISCTDVRAAQYVTALEARLGVIVVTSNQATLWDLLKASQYAGAGRIPGRLSTESI